MLISGQEDQRAAPVAVIGEQSAVPCVVVPRFSVEVLTSSVGVLFVRLKLTDDEP
jgi:hypothetical protein